MDYAEISKETISFLNHIDIIKKNQRLNFGAGLF